MVLLGFAAVFFSGFICGVAPLPIKFMRRFRYEHWGLLSSFLAFLAIPAVALCALHDNGYTGFFAPCYDVINFFFIIKATAENDRTVKVF